MYKVVLQFIPIRCQIQYLYISNIISLQATVSYTLVFNERVIHIVVETPSVVASCLDLFNLLETTVGFLLRDPMAMWSKTSAWRCIEDDYVKLLF